jgi:thymidylate synthase
MREAIIFGLNGMYGYQWGEEGQTDNQINKYLKQLKKNKI